jgi:hypothetical protein
MAFVEGQDLCAGVAEQNRRVGGDDELSVFIGTQCVVDEDEKGELPLGGERSLGFVEQEEAVALELVFEEGEKGFSVGAGV